MVASVRDSNSNGANTGTAISITAPTLVAGDALVVGIGINGQRTVADNNGAAPFDPVFTEDAGTDTGTFAVFTRRADGTEGASFNFTGSGSDRWAIWAAAIQGGHATLFFEQWPILLRREAATAIILPDHFVPEGHLALASIAPDGVANLITNFPNGYTANENYGATNATIALGSIVQGSHSYMNNPTFTITSAQVTMAMFCVMKEAEAAAAGGGMRLAGRGGLAMGA